MQALASLAAKKAEELHISLLSACSWKSDVPLGKIFLLLFVREILARVLALFSSCISFSLRVIKMKPCKTQVLPTICWKWEQHHFHVLITCSRSQLPTHLYVFVFFRHKKSCSLAFPGLQSGTCQQGRNRKDLKNYIKKTPNPTSYT